MYNPDTHENDLALVELFKAVEFNKDKRLPACLQQEQFVGEKFTAVSSWHVQINPTKIQFPDWMGRNWITF